MKSFKRQRRLHVCLQERKFIIAIIATQYCARISHLQLIQWQHASNAQRHTFEAKPLPAAWHCLDDDDDGKARKTLE
jgi:hypothetical protein